MGTLRGRVRAGNPLSLVEAPGDLVGWPTRYGWRTLGALFIGFSLSAATVFGIPALVVEPAWSQNLHHELQGEILGVVASTAILTDLVSLSRRRLSPLGISRQTPKGYLYSERVPTHVGGFLWGLDTGTGFSTYRVSSSTWVLYLAALLGLAPWWTGLSYAAGFTVPLVSVVAFYSRANDLTSAITRALHRWLWVAQAICVGALLVLLVQDLPVFSHR